jgi:hypothetical protein
MREIILYEGGKAIASPWFSRLYGTIDVVQQYLAWISRWTLSALPLADHPSDVSLDELANSLAGKVHSGSNDLQCLRRFPVKSEAQAAQAVVTIVQGIG